MVETQQGERKNARPFQPLPLIRLLVESPPQSQQIRDESTVILDLMIVNLSFDSSVNSAPAGFVATVNAVAQFFQATFSDNVTINVAVGFGEVAGQTVTSLGESITQLSTYTYTQVRNALISDAKSSDDSSAVASLPTSSP